MQSNTEVILIFLNLHSILSSAASHKMAIVWGFFTCLASFLLFNFFNVLLQTVIALENVCDHLYVKLNTWIYCQIVLFLFTCKIGDKWISNNQFEHVYLNLYIPSNLSRIKKVKVARLQTMRPSLVKLTALSGISPFTTNACFDY